MKTYVWIVIVVVASFLGLIVSYTLSAPDDIAGGAATITAKPH